MHLAANLAGGAGGAELFAAPQCHAKIVASTPPGSGWFGRTRCRRLWRAAELAVCVGSGIQPCGLYRLRHDGLPDLLDDAVTKSKAGDLGLDHPGNRRDNAVQASCWGRLLGISKRSRLSAPAQL